MKKTGIAMKIKLGLKRKEKNNMIPKLWCFIFGHKIREWVVIEMNQYRQSINGYWKWLKKCPRCGAKL
jgi:hypothetical protein